MQWQGGKSRHKGEVVQIQRRQLQNLHQIWSRFFFTPTAGSQADCVPAQRQLTEMKISLLTLLY